jgi:hypothetical protein
MPGRYEPITDEEMLSEGEYDDVWPVRPANSARRYQGLSDVRNETGRSADVQAQVSPRGSARSTGERHTIPPRRTATQARIPALPTTSTARIARDEEEQAQQSRKTRVPARLHRGARRPHWLFFVGLAMFAMILSWVVVSAVSSWGQTTLNDLRYGRPRTYQTDAVVGHRDSVQNPSHFIAMNLNRHIIVIEIPGGDVSKSVVYSGPTLLGPGQDLTPVTLSFEDINHDGKPDMIMNVQGSQFIFLNEKGTFVPTNQNSNSTS